MLASPAYAGSEVYISPGKPGWEFICMNEIIICNTLIPNVERAC